MLGFYFIINMGVIMKKVLYIINLIVFIVTLSISFVILFRPFYYYQIKYLDLEKDTGYTYNEIKEAYDDVLDYCVLNKEFKTGKLKYSEEGKSHFKDVKILFIICFILLIISLIIIIIKLIKYNKVKIKGFNPSFYSSISIILICILLLAIALIIGFDKCFDIFHMIFFYGKDNWLFDSYKDEIINILPKAYFMNCAILAISLINSISLIIIIKEIINKIKNK